MSETSDPRCPECGGPIGRTATYCMHCSADLTEERSAADADGDGAWDRTGPSVSGPADAAVDASTDASGVDRAPGAGDTGGRTDRLLAPDGLVDDTLTVLVGIAGGIAVGLVGTVVLLVATGSGWAVAFGVTAWLVATAYLVRRRTVQAAVAKSGYAVAAVLLSVPVIALSPVVEVDGGLEERGGLFLVLLVGVAVPAAVAAAVGWIAGRFVAVDEP
ncbi:hypothetical protein BRC94_00390 [Halobacteriales archaeon QS_5_70_17]|nr:MAG: hypothetical protein BRC94_00390 [Halobacteriales archaeon QS_5_70_17]